MAERLTKYGTESAITITLASLAASSTFVAGREGTEVDNSSALALDHLLSGLFTTGTSPVAGAIEVWVIPQRKGGTYPDVFDGTDSTETVTSRDILMASGFLVWSVATDATSDRPYAMRKTSLVQSLGYMPKKYVPFVVHNTTVNLNATAGNHEMTYEPLTETIA
jgi:hypothetical protein